MILILGEYTPSFTPHQAIDSAIHHACSQLGTDVEHSWISTGDITAELLKNTSGVWIAPGSPYKNLGKALQAIRHAREQGLPCLGTCGGFQHIIIEYARHVLGFVDAQHAEYDPYASNLFISRLDCSLAGRAMELHFAPESRVAAIYGSLRAMEQYYCNFGIAPNCVPLFRSGALGIVGWDAEGDVRVVELAGHPFFVGTLFVPALTSTPESPHPLIVEFLRATLNDRGAGSTGSKP